MIVNEEVRGEVVGEETLWCTVRVVFPAAAAAVAAAAGVRRLVIDRRWPAWSPPAAATPSSDADIIRHVSTSPLRPHCAVTCHFGVARAWCIGRWAGERKGSEGAGRRPVVGAQSGKGKEGDATTERGPDNQRHKSRTTAVWSWLKSVLFVLSSTFLSLLCRRSSLPSIHISFTVIQIFNCEAF